MRKIPFFRRIIFKVLLLVITVLSIAFSVSFMITTQKVDERIERNLIDKFDAAQHTTKNFINLISQTSQMWAKEIALAHFPKTKNLYKDFKEIDAYIKTQKEVVSADAVILLNKDGGVLSQTGSVHKTGDSLIYYDVVRQTLQTQKPVTKIARENESFILYSSAIIENENEIQGMILVGYFLNDIFLENIKQNTNLEIALIGNSAVMSSTKWEGETNLDILPVAYLHYQNLLKNKKRFKEITYNGKSFVVSAKKLYDIESSMTGSILFAYPYDWIKKQEKEIMKEQLILFGIIFLVSVLIISIIVIRYSKYLNRLSQAAIKLSNRESYEKIKINTHDELELLADSFNTMANELNILHRNMEKEIAYKTKELKALNENLELIVKKEVAKNREKDKQLIQQSRMALMGEMLSMIAHQWRQPLAAISATSASIELKASLNKLDNDTAQQKAHDISNFSQHLSRTIDDFRDFFKPNKEKRETTYDEVVKSVLEIIEVSLTHKDIQLLQEFNCHDTFSTYPNELKQVILNLIKNAEDALLEKEIKDPYIKISTYKKNEKYILEISDNAGGIPEEIMKNIFDPYFSTKTKKDGTGLGLYMSKTIVEEHCNGELSAMNTEDGALFKIALHKILPSETM